MTTPREAMALEIAASMTHELCYRGRQGPRQE